MSNVSNKQHEANKQNALLGGVKTAEGKAISRYNAQRHGILRETVSDYEKADYERIFNEFCDFFDVQTLIEEIFVERLVVAYVKLMRVSRAENELMRTALEPTKRMDFEIYQKVGYEAVLAPEQVAMLSDTYSRYETAVENRMYRAISKLQELKKTNV